MNEPPGWLDVPFDSMADPQATDEGCRGESAAARGSIELPRGPVRVMTLSQTIFPDH
jgi:hypothetical protein